MGFKDELAQFKRSNPKNKKVQGMTGKTYGASRPGNRKDEYMNTRHAGEGYGEWKRRKGYS